MEKTADKYDAAQKKLKKRYRLKLTREEGEVKAQPDGHQTDDIEAADIASTDEILDRDTGKQWRRNVLMAKETSESAKTEMAGKPDTMMQKAIAIQSMERHKLKSVSGLQKL